MKTLAIRAGAWKIIIPCTSSRATGPTVDALVAFLVSHEPSGDAEAASDDMAMSTLIGPGAAAICRSDEYVLIVADVVAAWRI